MAMFGSSRPKAFKPTAYGNTRRARRIPRWLVLIMTGIVLGAGGLLFLQTSYGPTRLTVEQSERLHYDLNSANIDKQRLQAQLNRQTDELAEARASLNKQTAAVAELQALNAKLTDDVQLFADAMPPDPRGTSPGIRAASFRNPAGQLDYQILIMQDHNKSAEFEGTMELVAAGRYANGKSANITLPPVDIKLGQYLHLHGNAPLPDTFAARQITVRINRNDNNKVAATRTLRVSR